MKISEKTSKSVSLSGGVLKLLVCIVCRASSQPRYCVGFFQSDDSNIEIKFYKIHHVFGNEKLHRSIVVLGFRIYDVIESSRCHLELLDRAVFI